MRSTLVLFALLSSLQSGQAATPASQPPRLLDLRWNDVPQGFLVAATETSWAGAPTSIRFETTIALPDDWEFKSANPRGIETVAVRRDPELPGHWRLGGNQREATGTLELDFLDNRDRHHRLLLATAARELRPHLVTTARCPKAELRLEPHVQQARFLFLASGCAENGSDELVLTFAHSPDAKWFPPRDAVQKSADSFAVKVKIPPSGGDAASEDDSPTYDRHVFVLHTEDRSGHRSEWSVVLRFDRPIKKL